MDLPITLSGAPLTYTGTGSSAAVLLPVGQATNMVVTNASPSVVASIAFGTDNTVTVSATLPGAGYYLLPNTQQVLAIPAGMTYAAIIGSGAIIQFQRVQGT